MSARNIHHQEVVEALKADKWTISHDPYRLPFADRDLYVDLGAERATLAAEKEGQRIAVEIQSFLNQSPIRALQESLGQYELYRAVLAQHESGRVLYMAVSQETYKAVLCREIGQFVLTTFRVKLLVFDAQNRRVVRWIE